MRKVRGLIDAQAVLPPENRYGGSNFAPSAGEGLRYERKLAIAAASLGHPVKHGQWFKFRDQKGVAYAQTDVLIKAPGRMIVLEAKLTQKAEGELKLSHLYVPLVREVFQLPVIPIMVFKNILWEPERLLSSLQAILDVPRRDQEKVHHLHWIGV